MIASIVKANGQIDRFLSRTGHDPYFLQNGLILQITFPTERN